MAEKKTTICDRCGKEMTFAVFPVLTGMISSAIKFGVNDYDYHAKTFDLCRDCTKAFKRFMNMKDGDNNAAD